MHIEIKIFPTFDLDNSISLQSILKGYESHCISLKAKNSGHLLKFYKSIAGEGVYAITNTDNIKLNYPSDIQLIKKIKPAYSSLTKKELDNLIDQEHYLLEQRNFYKHRLELDEMHGSIFLSKTYGYEGMIEVLEYIDNSLEKRMNKIELHQLEHAVKKLGYAFELASDIDENYQFLHPIYLISLTVAKFCGGVIQIDYNHIEGILKSGLYTIKELEQAILKVV